MGTEGERTQEPFEKRFLKPPKSFKLKGIWSEAFSRKTDREISVCFTGTGFTSENDAMRHSRGHGKITYKYNLYVIPCPVARGGFPAQGRGGETPG